METPVDLTRIVTKKNESNDYLASSVSNIPLPPDEVSYFSKERGANTVQKTSAPLEESIELAWFKGMLKMSNDMFSELSGYFSVIDTCAKVDMLSRVAVADTNIHILKFVPKDATATLASSAEQTRQQLISVATKIRQYYKSIDEQNRISTPNPPQTTLDQKIHQNSIKIENAIRKSLFGQTEDRPSTIQGQNAYTNLTTKSHSDKTVCRPTIQEQDIDLNPTQKSHYDKMLNRKSIIRGFQKQLSILDREWFYWHNKEKEIQTRKKSLHVEFSNLNQKVVSQLGCTVTEFRSKYAPSKASEQSSPLPPAKRPALYDIRDRSKSSFCRQ